MGIDISAVALRMSAEAAARQSLKCQLKPVCASMLDNLPFVSRSFDSAMCLTAIENLITNEQVALFVAELERVLRVNSHLLLYRLTRADGFYAPRLYRSDEGVLAFSEDIGIQQRIFSRTEIERLFAPWFRILRSKYFHFEDFRGGATYTRSLEALVLGRSDTTGTIAVPTAPIVPTGQSLERS